MSLRITLTPLSRDYKYSIAQVLLICLVKRAFARTYTVLGYLVKTGIVEKLGLPVIHYAMTYTNFASSLKHLAAPHTQLLLFCSYWISFLL